MILASHHSTIFSNHRRIADEYCGGAAVTKFPTKYFRIEFMRREFVVRVIGTLLVVLYILVNKLV